MSDFKFELPEKFITELHTHLEDTRLKKNSEYSQYSRHGLGNIGFGGFLFSKHAEISELYSSKLIPPKNLLSKIIATSFWASLEREEGRPLSFSISYEESVENDIPSFRFAIPLSFDVPTLVKIAPAIGTDAAIQLWSTNNTEIRIWGRRESESNYLSIKVLDPGQLIVKAFGEPIAILSGAEIFLIRNSLLGRYGSMWDKLGRTEPYDKYDFIFDTKKNSLIQITKQMRQFGHGGAVIIVDENSSFMKSIEDIKYKSAKSYSDLQFTLNYYLNNKNESSDQTLQMNQALQQAAKDLATFTCVDGATILDKDLAIIGFGAKLKPANNDIFPEKIIKIDPFEHNKWLDFTTLHKLGGTRHQSAARFAFDNKDAIAIVVSQDGVVSIFVWEKGTNEQEYVFNYRRLEATIF